MPSGPPTDSRSKILDVAEALFARKGYAGVGLREVAHDVGLSKSSLFHHFPTKLDLYREVLERVLERLEVGLASAFGSDLACAERLDRVIDALVDVLAEHPTTSRLALRSLFEEGEGAALDADAPTELDAVLARLIGRFERLIADGVAAGDFREVSPGHLTQTIIGATIYHFASAELGEEILGAPIFSADQVDERKRELKALIRNGIRND